LENKNIPAVVLIVLLNSNHLSFLGRNKSIFWEVLIFSGWGCRTSAYPCQYLQGRWHGVRNWSDCHCSTVYIGIISTLV